MVEEGEVFAGRHRFDPQGDFAEFDRHRVEVDAVEASRDDVADGFANEVGRGMFVPGSDGGETFSESSRGADEEVPAAAGGVADLQIEDGVRAFFFISFALFSNRFGGIVFPDFNFRNGGEGGVDDGVERGIEERRDEFGGRVEGPRRFAVVSGDDDEREVVRVRLFRLHFEEGFVDGAELFGAEIAVVDRLENVVSGRVR